MSNFFGTAIAGSSNTVVYDGPVYEGYNVNDGGEFSIAIESAQENLNILSAMAAMDIELTQYVAESLSGETHRLGEMEVALEATGSGVINRIKEAIKKLWGKIKAFFASVVRTLDGLTKSTEDFAKKYKTQLEKLKLSGFKYEMHRYTVEELVIDYKGSVIQDQTKVVDHITSFLGKGVDAERTEQELKSIDDAISAHKDKNDERLDAFRGSIIGKAKLDAGEFSEELYKALRNGKEESEKEEIDVNIHSILNEIKDTGKLKNKISKAQSEADKEFKNAITMVEKLEKSFTKASTGPDNGSVEYERRGSQAKYGGADGVNPKLATRAATIASMINSTLSAQQAIVNSAITAWSNAVKERDAVYKKVLIKAFSYKQKD